MGSIPAIGRRQLDRLACRDDQEWRSLAQPHRRGLVYRSALVDRVPSRVTADRPSSTGGSASGPRPSTASSSPRRFGAAGVPAAAGAASRPNESMTIPPRPTGVSGQQSPTRRWVRSASTASRCISPRPTGSIARGAPCLGEHNESSFGTSSGIPMTNSSSSGCGGGAVSLHGSMGRHAGPLEGVRVSRIGQRARGVRRKDPGRSRR